MITDRDSAFIFSCMKRGDYLPFVVSNMREEFGPLPQMVAQQAERLRNGAKPNMPPETICSWCPDAQERTRLAMLANGGRPVSHGICASCKARLDAEMDAEEGK